MAFLTLAQLNVIFHGLLVDITGLNPKRIRTTYPPQGQPGFTINDDYIFITLSPIDNPYDKNRYGVAFHADPVSGQGPMADVTTYYTRVFQLLLNIYGPNSLDLADTIRYRILTEDSLATLADAEIAPITEIPPAPRVPELFNGQWWERSDLKIMLNIGTSRADEIPYFEQANVYIEPEYLPEQPIHIEEF